MKPELKAALVARLWRLSVWPLPLSNYAINVEREVDLIDMLAYAAGARNSARGRQSSCRASFETVVTSFKKLFEALRGCEDDDDVGPNIRNLQSACPSLQESAIIPSSRSHTSTRCSASSALPPWRRAHSRVSVRHRRRQHARPVDHLDRWLAHALIFVL